MDRYGISQVDKAGANSFQETNIEFIVENHLSFKIVESETFNGHVMDEYGSPC
jgi:hypothetical protein